MSLFSLTRSWQRIAASGQDIIVQNAGGMPVIIVSSTGVPTTTDGLTLMPGESRQGKLAADLYARADPAGAIEVIVDLFGSTTVATPTSSPGGGPTNTADFSDPNNAYLAALAA